MSSFKRFDASGRSYRHIGAVLGVLLGFGAPLGAILFRPILAGEMSYEWIRQDIIRYVDFYVYMAFSTPLVFGLFGAYLGYLNDEIQCQKTSLENINTLLKDQSMTDDATGLYNHRHLMEVIEKELMRAKRYSRFLSGMMVDVDDFKSINDYYGHLIGDSVLREMAAILKNDVRKVDLVGRYGGDEFVVLLPETSGELARNVANRIQKDVRQYRFKTLRDYISVSVSIGVVHFSDVKDFDKLLFVEKLDEAMYKAKSMGKDRIHSE